MAFWRKKQPTGQQVANEAADMLLDQAEKIVALQVTIRRYAELLDKQNGTPCAQIRWQQEREELQAEIDRLRALLNR